MAGGVGMLSGGVGGGMHGSGCVHDQGVCMAGGHVWWGACMAGGTCVAGGMRDMHPPGRYYGYGIRSMSGLYASYWNTFLLDLN